MKVKASRLIPDDAILHESITRTFEQNSVNHQISYQGDGKRGLTRNAADFGARLTAITDWSFTYSSNSLDQLSRSIALRFVAAGNIDKIATLQSCGFLVTVSNDCNDDLYDPSLVQAMLVYVSKYMDDALVASEWYSWSNFCIENPELFTADDLAMWKQKALKFCKCEIAFIIAGSGSSDAAQESYDEVEQIVERWDVSLDDEHATFDEWIAQVKAGEEAAYDRTDNRERTLSTQTVSANNSDIDQLFDSLSYTHDAVQESLN